MKFLTAFALLLSGISIANAVPSSIAIRNSDVSVFLEERAANFYNLFDKRRGGGGRVGGGFGNYHGTKTLRRQLANGRTVLTFVQVAQEAAAAAVAANRQTLLGRYSGVTRADGD